MLMYECQRGHAGDTGGYGVSIYVQSNRSGFCECGVLINRNFKTKFIICFIIAHFKAIIAD